MNGIVAAQVPLAPLPTLAPESMHLDSLPRIVYDELADIIRHAMDAHPRSQQRSIGPSELGTPCMRRLGFRLADVEHERSGAWLPTIGTAVHAWLAEALADYNTRVGFTRYLVETKVSVGEVGAREVRGSADVYDRVTGTVIDWKIVGATTLKAVKRNGPTELYRTQVHLYGRGFVRRGVPVRHVAIAYLPRNGALSAAHYYVEAYDEQVALDALARADSVQRALDVAGAPLVLPGLPRVDDCMFCPWHDQVGGGDPNTTCAGPLDKARKRSSVHDLIATSD